MLSGIRRLLRPLLLWTYPRGSWQYDVLAVAILMFIFLTPRELFRDQARPPSVQQIEVLSEDPAVEVFLVEPFVIDETPPAEVDEKLRTLLRQRTGRDLSILYTRPSTDDEGEVRAYLVYARP